MPEFALAVDIGGTFTDAVVRNRDGRTWVDKSLTTYDDLLIGFFAAARAAMRRAGVAPGDIDDVVVHATTLVTNCVIQRAGAKTALLTTAGFRDVLHLRDESRSNIYDNQIEFVSPLVPRDYCFGVNERVLASGEVIRPVDGAEVEALARQLVREGIESVAVCFLHAYKNPANEQAAADAIARVAPQLFVSLSSEVAPQIREYHRATTTVVNAYAMPRTYPYLNSLADRLVSDGFNARPLIMLSSGGIIGVDVAGRFPVRMIESGPAAGALAAKFFSAALNEPSLVAFDMGGTTAKAAFIKDGEPYLTGLFEVDRKYRFEPGSGMPIVVPCIDMIEIGAGGGSIAAIDDLGLLKVGPESAGSEPGPVCYGRGGIKPTVTDADLVLGMLDADNFLGGDLQLDLAAAHDAMAELAKRLGSSVEDTAKGIYQVVCESMASAVRSHAVDHGLDWRGLTLLAFGGAGPVHACHVAELLESRRVVFPPLASVLSAFGALVSPVRLDLARAELHRLQAIDWASVRRIQEAMRAQGIRALVKAGCVEGELTFRFSADMRYVGQQFEVCIDVEEDILRMGDAARMRKVFEDVYERAYAVRLADMEVEVVTWRASIYGTTPTKKPGRADASGASGGATHRRVVFPEGPVDARIYRRSDLSAGESYHGPAVIEERETTLVVPSKWQFELNHAYCIVATYLN